MGRTRANRSATAAAPAAPPPRLRRWRRRLIALTVAAAALVVGGTVWFSRSRPAAVPPPALPDVLLITLDTTRADHLGSYGYAGAATPNLDRLAADGVRFERALSPVPLTLPAHASLLTGRQPFTHGVRNNGHFVLPAEVPTLAAALATRGYDTAAFVSSFVLDRQFGLARGFSHYDDGLDEAPPGPAASLELERRGDRTVAAARGWLAGAPGRGSSRPYFLWVHLYDAHDPYVPPSPFRERFADRLYDGEIAFDDAVVGELLDAAGYGSANGPLVVVAGDHGESLGDHGESTHGLFVYDGAVRVPLIIAWPGVVAPAVATAAIGLIDVAPTILDLAGAGVLAGAEGRSRRELMRGGGAREELPPVYAETYFPQFFMQWSPLRAIEAGRWKYVDAPEPELYDLRDDPAESVNLVAREPARVASLKRALDGLTGAEGGRRASAPLTDEARSRLASLGYLSAAAPLPPPTSGRLPDPKRMVALFEQLLDGNRALARGDAAQATRIARAVLAKDDANAFARWVLGRAALAAGRHREAIVAFKAYLVAVPGSADAHHWIALAALRMGDRVEALAEEEAALAIDPRHTAALSLKAGLLFSGGRKDDGLQVLQLAVARDTANTTLRIELADLLTDAGRYLDAEGEYRRALATRPGDGRALLGLGLVLSATGRAEAAGESLNQAVDADPRNAEARFARAEVSERLGRVAAARLDYDWVATNSNRPDLKRAAAARRDGLREK